MFPVAIEHGTGCCFGLHDPSHANDAEVCSNDCKLSMSADSVQHGLGLDETDAAFAA